MVAKLCEIIADGVEAATCVPARAGATLGGWGGGGGAIAFPVVYIFDGAARLEWI